MSADRPFRSFPAPVNLRGALVAGMVLVSIGPMGLFAGCWIWSGHTTIPPEAIGGSGFAALLILCIAVFGLGALHRWAIGWFWFVMLLAVLIHLLAVAVCGADLLGLTSGGRQDRDHMAAFWLILLVAIAPSLPFAMRFLRDPFWHAWRAGAGSDPL